MKSLAQFHIFGVRLQSRAWRLILKLALTLRQIGFKRGTLILSRQLYTQQKAMWKTIHLRMHVKEKAGGALDKGNLYLGCDMSWKSWMAAAKGNITSGTSEWVIFNDLSLTVLVRDSSKELIYFSWIKKLPLI